jgi:hypothetical protein
MIWLKNSNCFVQYCNILYGSRRARTGLDLNLNLLYDFCPQTFDSLDKLGEH